MVISDIRGWSVSILLVALLGCVNQSRFVDAEQTLSTLTEPPASYELEAVDVPGFMRDMIEVSLHAAMQTLGYSHRRQTQADLYISAEYEQIDVPNVGHERDSMAEAMSMTDPRQFVARVNIEIRDARGKPVWQGSVQRLHSVDPGDYMHRGHAANNIAQALVDLIESNKANLPDS